MQDIGRFDPVQDHVHDADDISEALFLLAGKGRVLKRFALPGGFGFRLEIFESFAQKSGRSARRVVNRFANLRIDDFLSSRESADAGV